MARRLADRQPTNWVNGNCFPALTGGNLPVRTIFSKGRLWYSGADILRLLDVDVSRRGASGYLRILPPSEIDVVRSTKYPGVFAGRRGNPQMCFVTMKGARLLINRHGQSRAGSASAMP